MLLAIDAHAIGCRLTGNEVYVRNLLAGLAALGADCRILAYVTASNLNGALPPGVERRQIARNPVVRLGYELSRKLRRDRPDLLHVQYTAPLNCPVPVVVTVHDVSFLERPEFFPLLRVQQLRFTVERTVRSAAMVITGSRFSCEAIQRAYALAPEKVTVVPNAAAPIFRPLDCEHAARQVAGKLGIRRPFILTVGDLQPRKNHIGLIEAFAAAKRADPGLPHSLVLAGKPTWFAPRIYEAAERSGLSAEIHFTGFISDEDLLLLYNACEFFVFPSFYEGFGLPLLEAMACGRAVACSNATACPEVAGPAALFFDPNSIDQMASAMLELAGNEKLRSRLEELGQERAAAFSWRLSAEMTLEAYRKASDVAGFVAGKILASSTVSQ